MRLLDVDALTCPECSSPMVVLAFLTDPLVVARVLRYLGLPTALPRPAAVALHLDPDPQQIHLDDDYFQLPPDEHPSPGRDPPD